MVQKSPKTVLSSGLQGNRNIGSILNVDAWNYAKCGVYIPNRNSNLLLTPSS